MIQAKRKGARREHATMRLLEDAGYRCTRAAASLGVFDIIGVGEADVALVQVKSNRWPGNAEMQTLREFKAPPGCRKLVHRWRDRKRVPDVREV